MVTITADPIAQERAIQLAIVYLTRRKDLHVVRSQDECQPDLMVSLLDEGLPSGKYLGVITKAVPEDSAHSIEQTLQDSNFDAFREAPFPVCLFLFTMDTDQGYWKWIRGPVASTHELSFALEQPVLPLDNASMDVLIIEVKRWYGGRMK